MKNLIDKPNTFTITLSINKVRARGNSGVSNGYAFAFSPTKIVLTQSIKKIKVEFKSDTKDEFVIYAFAINKGQKNYQHIATNKRSLEIPSVYQKDKSYSLTIYAINKNDPDTLITCDPQVRNSPPPY